MPGASLLLLSIFLLTLTHSLSPFPSFSVLFSLCLSLRSKHLDTARKTGHVYSCCFTFTSQSNFLFLTITFCLTPFCSLFTCFFLPLLFHWFRISYEQGRKRRKKLCSLLVLISLLQSVGEHNAWATLGSDTVCDSYRWKRINISSSMRGLTYLSPEINKKRTPF